MQPCSGPSENPGARVASPGAPPRPPAAAEVPRRPAGAQLDAALLLRRAQAADSVVDLIGGTPLVRLANLEPPGVELWAKCEFTNPAGSVKDRAALRIVREALATGALPAGFAQSDADALCVSIKKWAEHWRCPMVGGDLASMPEPLRPGMWSTNFANRDSASTRARTTYTRRKARFRLLRVMARAFLEFRPGPKGAAWDDIRQKVRQR